jgi:membrane protein implicated in regulation of membrane protease activity
MSTLPLFLAELPTGKLLAYWYGLGAAARGVIALFGALTVVTLLVLAWAAFFRKRRKRRRKHRPRNPTLAETGGLPPNRPERPPELFS